MPTRARTIKYVIDVYIGRNSPQKVTIDVEGVPVPFQSEGVQSMGVVINGVEYGDPYVTFNDLGEVTFSLGAAPDLKVGKFYSRLIAYSTAHPLGKPLFTEGTSNRIQFQIR